MSSRPGFLLRGTDMKKILLSFVMFVFFAFCCAPAFSAGTCTVTEASAGTYMVHTVTYSCTGDSSTGSIPATASPYIFGWVFTVEVLPGSPAPTNGYDLTLSNVNGIDVMEGALADLSDTTKTIKKPAACFVAGALTLAASGQSAAGAKWTVIISYYLEK